MEPFDEERIEWIDSLTDEELERLEKFWEYERDIRNFFPENGFIPVREENHPKHRT